jgi:hypothetical protein
MADPDRDGDADLVFGGFGAPSLIYRNEIDVGHHGLSLRLVGTTSNTQGFGAHVWGYTPGQPPQHLVVGDQGNLLGVSEPLAFLGTGTHPVLDRLEIHWPSGFVQEITDLPSDTLHRIVEPTTVEIMDQDRHVPADGTSRLTILLTPRNPDGSPDTRATVDVTAHGDAVLIGPVRVHDHWEVQLVAPSVPGESWLEIFFDGHAIRSRPRVWWDDT